MQAPLLFADPQEEAPLRVVVLDSGRGGNAVVVEAGGVRILVDAGFSCRELERRKRVMGVDPKFISAMLLTHEREDRVRGAGRFALWHKVPVWATAGTLRGSELPADAMATVERLEFGHPEEV